MQDGSYLLWQAVIYQAIYDAKNPVAAQRDRQAAITWLKSNSKDMNFVCQMAGVSAETIRVFVNKKLKV